MKYCQKCKAMLKDEVEICPICGYTQKPAEEVEAAGKKKQKIIKTVTVAVSAVLGAVLIFMAVCMIFGKEPEVSAVDETYTTAVTDEELMGKFVSYAEESMPWVWSESDENLDSDIEYYTANNYPEVVAGMEQIKALRPIAGSLVSMELKDAAQSENGTYKLIGEMVCENAKVIFTITINSSGYIDGLSFEQKEETVPQKVRYYLTENVFK